MSPASIFLFLCCYILSDCLTTSVFFSESLTLCGTELSHVQILLYFKIFGILQEFLTASLDDLTINQVMLIILAFRFAED